MDNSTPLLTVAEVAAIANVHPETVRRWAREGVLAAIALPGGRKRFHREDVNALLSRTGDAT